MAHHWIKSESNASPGTILLSKFPVDIDPEDGGRIVSEEMATHLFDGRKIEPQIVIFGNGQTGQVYDVTKRASDRRGTGRQFLDDAGG